MELAARETSLIVFGAAIMLVIAAAVEAFDVNDFVARGYPVVVPDWPGVGRSDYVPLDRLTGESSSTD